MRAASGARNGHTAASRRSDHRRSGTHPTRPEEQPMATTLDRDLG